MFFLLCDLELSFKKCLSLERAMKKILELIFSKKNFSFLKDSINNLVKLGVEKKPLIYASAYPTDPFFKTEVKNYYCTKLMSKLARSYSSNHGLKDLCQELCNVKLEMKYGSSTDWNKNLSEISDKEANYAANDVRYLKTIKDKLQAMLER